MATCGKKTAPVIDYGTSTVEEVVPLFRSVVSAPSSTPLLDEAARYVLLAPAVERLRTLTVAHAEALSTRRVTMFSSTSAGGGVSEMLHSMIPILRELGIPTRWFVIKPASQVAPAFFALTKSLHNGLHGETHADFSLDTDKAIYEHVNDSCVTDFIGRYGVPDPSSDVYIFHDPQVAGMLPRLSAGGTLCVWRCHIGVDSASAVAKRAWQFLEPYVTIADACVFSAQNYINEADAALGGGKFLRKSFVVTPGLAPLSNKNIELSLSETVSILVRGGIFKSPAEDASARCGMVDEPFAHRAAIYAGEGVWVTVAVADDDGELQIRRSATEVMPYELEAERARVQIKEQGVPLLFQPVITQVSRWDNLKGFGPLLEGFHRLKESPTRHFGAWERGSKELAHSECSRAEKNRAGRQLCQTALLLCGPAPGKVSDDPEDQSVLAALCAQYDALPESTKTDVYIMTLPMDNPEENSLMVNAIQRASTILVQNSTREGFGLTCSEGRFKRKPFVGTSAAGLAAQITHGVDGILVGDAADPSAVAAALYRVVCEDELRAAIATNGQTRAVRDDLVYSNAESWISTLALSVLPSREMRGEVIARAVAAAALARSASAASGAAHTSTAARHE